MRPKAANLRGYINRGGGHLRTLSVFIVRVNVDAATVLLVSSATPPVRQARGRIRGPSSPDRDASTRTCGYLGGAASAAQGRAAREEVLATALPASICTTPTRYRSSATARLVVIP